MQSVDQLMKGAAERLVQHSAEAAPLIATRKSAERKVAELQTLMETKAEDERRALKRMYHAGQLNERNRQHAEKIFGPMVDTTKAANDNTPQSEAIAV
ncbi:hypothetical protein HW532_12830 [Kaustia mangrovi]|uniref:Uncharacterized protein n=1 Tax=Kaustia mangrovi TaxID=2593653 RepID=A0A7S8C4Y7_9HYPH|nr:hypothetical protein [Kaustia mangrovi]QPC43502.1 hypothetical protein HW532_12830 [Kaustia mangrovi]